MKNKIVNISFIDGNLKNQRYCFLVKPIVNGSVAFLGFFNYNFKKEMNLKTFLSICEEYTHRPDKYLRRPYSIIYAIKKFDFNIDNNNIFFTIMNLINLKVDAKSPIKFKIRSLNDR